MESMGKKPRRACELLKVSRAAYYAARRNQAAKRGKKTTIADPAAAARADRIRRDFTADASKINTSWCGDITYLATWEGWLYLRQVARPLVTFPWAPHCPAGPAIRAVIGPSSR